jgi:type I restriction enzyme S subunit
MVMSDLPNGKALAKCFYVDENDKYTLNQRICALTIKDNDELNAKFLFYILNRNKQLLRYDSGADQTNLRKDDILNIEISIPSLTEQHRIVVLLDKFDALVNDISAGLPAELNARRKQYEYYRGKLLNFKEYE